MKEKTESRADRLSRVVLPLEEELADILEQLCEEIQADLQKGRQSAFSNYAWKDSPAERELRETLAEIEDGKSAMYDAWNSLYHINMLYDLDAPGETLAEREQA